MAERRLTLVLSKNVRIFWHEAENIFGDELSEAKLFMISGQIRFPDGREYRYMSGRNSMRGFHDVDVEFWGPAPDWAHDPDVEYQIKILREERNHHPRGSDR